MQSRQLLGQPN